MRNVAYSGNVMQSTTPRFDATFEKTLPRAFFSKTPPIIKPSKPSDWRTLGIVRILAATFLAAIAIIAPHQQPAAKSAVKTALTPEDLRSNPG